MITMKMPILVHVYVLFSNRTVMLNAIAEQDCKLSPVPSSNVGLTLAPIEFIFEVSLSQHPFEAVGVASCRCHSQSVSNAL